MDAITVKVWLDALTPIVGPMLAAVAGGWIQGRMSRPKVGA